MKVLFASIMAFAPLFCAAQESGPTQPEQPLTIEDIQCRGNAATSCGFILGHLYLSAGDRVDEDEIQNARLRLASLPNFDSVDIYLQRGSQQGRALLIVEVAEADPVAKETTIGASTRLSSIGQTIAARASHQNLFGTGKILDLDLAGRIPISEPVSKNFYARLQFVDPHLFDSKKYFLSGGAYYRNQLDRNLLDEFYDSERLGINLTFGRRLWDFSYLTIGYEFRPTSRTIYCNAVGYGRCKTRSDFSTQLLLLGYGWNSEDDAYFPTQGSRFSALQSFGNEEPGCVELCQRSWTAVHYRKTWKSGGNSLWTFKLGGTPGTQYRSSLNEDALISLVYARPISFGFFAASDRGRWYVEPGITSVGYSTRGEHIREVGIKAGVRLQLKSLGIVELYALGSTSVGFGE